MEDRKSLLGELKIDALDRESKGRLPQYLVMAGLALVLAVLAWFMLVPEHQPVEVRGIIVKAADGLNANAANTVLDASGYVTARRQATVSSKVTGKVKEVFIEEGITVAENQLLATLDDSSERAQYNLSLSQVKQVESGQKEVQVQLDQARITLGRTVELAKDKLASQDDLDNARLAVDSLTARLERIGQEIEVANYALKLQQQRLDDLEIRAPFAGVVIAKSAQPGEMISPVSAGGGFTRTGICTIVDMDSLEIEVDVNEAYINRVSAKQPVTATLNSYQNWKIPAEVITIIPTADRNKATVRVRIAFLQRDNRILPDMGVKVSFMEEAVGNAQAQELHGVLVPSGAIIQINGANYVYVIGTTDATGNSLVEAREVQLGAKVGSQRNVTDGLIAGERIVAELPVDPSQHLRDGARVSIN